MSGYSFFFMADSPLTLYEYGNEDNDFFRVEHFFKYEKNDLVDKETDEDNTPKELLNIQESLDRINGICFPFDLYDEYIFYIY